MTIQVGAVRIMGNKDGMVHLEEDGVCWEIVGGRGRMDIGKNFNHRGSRSRGIGGWMRKQSVPLGHL